MTNQTPIIRGQFGPMMREFRIRKNLTLRAFCTLADTDPGNYSRIERGLFAPPDDNTVRKYAEAVGLSPSAKETSELVYAAAIDRGALPEDILRDEQIVGELPLLFRSLRGEPMTDAELDRLADIIRRKSNGANKEGGPVV